MRCPRVDCAEPCGYLSASEVVLTFSDILVDPRLKSVIVVSNDPHLVAAIASRVKPLEIVALRSKDMENRDF